jgi:DNA repair protein SbcD/Mre11
MKIIHTSDWHLGQRFYDNDRFEEHELFLRFLLDIIKQENAELIIIAGDIFDTANPSREAERIYYDFLRSLAELKICQALIIGGNHDSAPHLDAPKRLLSAFNIHVTGAMPNQRKESIYTFKSNHGEEVCIAAIPYLRDRDVRKAVRGESFEDMEERAKAGIVQCYQEIAELITEKNLNNMTVIGTGHLTMVGARISESERSIHIGNLGSISVDQFPDCFDYIALGHMHRAQKVGNCEHIRYSGSPVPLSFGEADIKKELRLLEIKGTNILQKSIPVPVFRRLLRFSGDTDALRKQIENMEIKENELCPWIELTVNCRELAGVINDELRELAAEKGAEVLKTTIESSLRTVVHQESEPTEIRELKPEQVFLKRMQRYEEDVPAETLIQCFRHLVELESENN